jgi:hypothetical protein
VRSGDFGKMITMCFFFLTWGFLNQ